MAKTKERYQKHIENYIPWGGNTTATWHMSSPVLGCHASPYYAGNLHPIKTEGDAESDCFLSGIKVEESEHFNKVTAFGDNAEHFVNVIVLNDD